MTLGPSRRAAESNPKFGYFGAGSRQQMGTKGPGPGSRERLAGKD